jgi:hypothetical protein
MTMRNQPEPDLELQEKTATSSVDHDIQLTANLQGQKVVISVTAGSADPSLPYNSGQHRFVFGLIDNTGLGVAFGSLDTQDNCSICPPNAGENSRQIVGVTINNNLSSFTDNNRGSAMDVSYQWNFTCNDSSKLPITFDPIIKNGGGN